MEKKKMSYLWVLALTILFPMLQNILFFLRFARLPAALALESLVFLPMGLISGVLYVSLIRKTEYLSKKTAITIAYIVGALIAIPLAITGGLLLPPLVATSTFGTIPMIIAMLLTYKFKKSNTST